MVSVQRQEVSMQTRDGIRLDADVYVPAGPGPFPVLLMRQPYGRAIASTIVYAPPSWYAAQGYMVVIQDVRGRGTSEGAFDLFAHETDDGADTVRWAAALPNSSGAVGMYGFSYQGMTQLYAAIGLGQDASAKSLTTSPLKTLCPAMIGYDLYADWAYEGQAFCLQLNWMWAVQLAAETARRRGDRQSYERLYRAVRQPPDFDPITGRSPLLDDLAPDSFYHHWLRHPHPDDYWSSLSPCEGFQGVDLPMLHIGGWYDTYLRGTLRLYYEMADRSRYRQEVWIGPWSHLPWGRQVGAMDFGPKAVSPIDRLQLQWFDQMLKGTTDDTPHRSNHGSPPSQSPQASQREPNAQNTKPLRSRQKNTVHLFDLGTHTWQTHRQWPAISPHPYSLSSTGLASTDTTDGRLVCWDALPLLDDTPNTSNTPTYDTLIHDPWRPMPAQGGHAAVPTGPYPRLALDDRTDCLTYTTPPLTQAYCIVGSVTVFLQYHTQAPSIDLCAVLSDVRPNGQVYNITQGIQRLNHASPAQSGTQPKPVAHTEIILHPTCITIPQHHALRLSIAAACYPAYSMNDGQPQDATRVEPALLDGQIITIELHWGDRTPSSLALPIVTA